MPRNRLDQTDKLEALQKALAIDKFEIDEEIVRHSQIHNEVGDEAAKAIANRDYLKDELARLDAALYLKYKVKLDKAGGRVTEASIQNSITLDKDRVALSGRYLKAKERADRYNALKDSFSQRGYMLRDLASLYVTKYYDADSIKGDAAKNLKAEYATKQLAKKRKERRSRENDE